MYSVTSEGRLKERQEARPPGNEPHHRTRRPEKSVLKGGIRSQSSFCEPIDVNQVEAMQVPPSLAGMRLSTGVAVVPPRSEQFEMKISSIHKGRYSRDRSHHIREPNVHDYRDASDVPPKAVSSNTTRAASSWPEIVLTNEEDTRVKLPVNDAQVLSRRTFLQNYAHALKVEAYQELLRIQVAPLNPILAAPPCPHFLFGTKFEHIFDSNIVMKWMSKRHGLPSIVWDVRNPPETAYITAWPYTPDPSMSRKEQMKRGPVDGSEVMRFYNQAVTNPPSTVCPLCHRESELC
jgi:hypothetical protein